MARQTDPIQILLRWVVVAETSWVRLTKGGQGGGLTHPGESQTSFHPLGQPSQVGWLSPHTSSSMSYFFLLAKHILVLLVLNLLSSCLLVLGQRLGPNQSCQQYICSVVFSSSL